MKMWAYRGFGKTDGAAFHLFGQGNISDIPPEVPPENYKDYYWGFGWGMADYFPFTEEGAYFEALLNKQGINKEWAEKALEGFKSYRRWHEGLLAYPG